MLIALLTIAAAADLSASQLRSAVTSPADTVRWVVERDPRIDVGDGETENEFFGRLVDAVLVGEEIHALDMSPPGILAYSEDGRFLRRYGGSGEGPGEFVRPTSIWADEAGRIHVFDEGLQRRTTFSIGGEVLGIGAVHGVVNRAGAVGAFADGTDFVREADAMASGRRMGLRRDTVLFATLDPEGEWDELIARVPGQYISVMEIEGRTSFRPAPFTPRPSHGVWGDCLVVTAGDVPHVDIYDSAGAPVGGFATDHEPRRIERQHVREWTGSVLGDAEGPQRAAAEAMIESLPRPDNLPVFSDLLVDPDGLVWLQLYEPPLGQGATLEIFDRAGGSRGVLVLPEPLLVFQVGEDFVLGRSTGALGVQRLRLYRFRRPSSDGRGPPPEAPPC